MDVEKFFKECLINMGYITFEIAKKLKEKDYPFNTSHYYDKDGNIIVALCNYDERCEYPMPEIHQVLKWLREKKKIYVTVNVEREDWFEYKIVQTIKNTHCTGTRVYETYNDAMLAGIEYTLNNLI